MEDDVKDAILVGKTEDNVLRLILEAVVTSITEDRPLFQSPMKDPAIYRKIKMWTRNGLAEKELFESSLVPENKDKGAS